GKVTLSYMAEKNGSYMFNAMERPDYSGKGEKELWSEKIMVKCIEKQEEDSKKVDEQEDFINGEDSNQNTEENTSSSQTEESKGEDTEKADPSETTNNNKEENIKEEATNEKV